jgi:hypothetical protein
MRSHPEHELLRRREAKTGIFPARRRKSADPDKHHRPAINPRKSKAM